MENMSNKIITIKLRQLFGETISTRQAVALLAAKIPTGAKAITIDFCDITFVSRSFAHEFLRFQDQWKSSLKIVHLLPEVQSILDLVARSRRHPHRDHDEEITNTSISLSDTSMSF